MQVYKCKNIITMNDNEPLLDGFIGVLDDKIAFIGTQNLGNDYIDCTEKIIMPGLINCHTHSPMVAFRGLADDVSLYTWLHDYIFPREAMLTNEDIYNYFCDAIDEHLAFGTTCIADMYLDINAAYNACNEKNIRANICSQGKNSELDDTDKIKIDVGLHSVYTAELDEMKNIVELGDSFHVHISETAKENEDCIEKHGITPTKLLANLGYFDKQLYAAHCVYLEEEDVNIFAESGASIAHCPSANLKLASGIAPITNYIDKGINVVLGTDGAASNNTLNMFNEIRLTAILHKGTTGNPEAIPAYTALKMATINGAKALGREDEIGSLEVGKQADFIVLDTNRPNMKPINNSISAVVYQANGSEVEQVYIAGKETL